MGGSEKSLAVDLAAGTIAGTAQLVVGHPFDTVKVKLQTQVGKYNGAFDCTKKVLATHGPKGLFKGMGTPLATVAVFNAVLFTTRGQMENLLAHPDGTPLTVGDQMTAGLGAGIAGSFLACPTELIKCRLQAQSGPRPSATQIQSGAGPAPVVRYSGPVSVFRHVVAHEGGLRGLFRGMTPTLLREVPGSAAMFGTYGFLKQSMADSAGLKSVDQLPKVASLAAGGLAGAAFWLAVYPMDVIKSKIQTDTAHAPMYKGTLDCAMKTWRHEGVAGFFRGFGPAMARSVPANAAAFAAYEVAVSFMKPTVTATSGTRLPAMDAQSTAANLSAQHLPVTPPS